MKSISLTDTEELYESFIDIPICQSNIDLYIYFEYIYYSYRANNIYNCALTFINISSAIYTVKVDCNSLNLNINQQQYLSILSITNYYNKSESSASNKKPQWKVILTRIINERKYQQNQIRKRQYKKYVPIYKQLLVCSYIIYMVNRLISKMVQIYQTK